MLGPRYRQTRAVPGQGLRPHSGKTRLETGLCGISCSDPGYPARTLDIPLWSGISRFCVLGYPAPERDISLSRYPARNQDISLARSARYPARERDIQGPSGISRFISLARYPAPERDISLRAGYLVPHRDIYRFRISRFWAGYLRIEISRSTSGYPAKSGLQTLVYVTGSGCVAPRLSRTS